MAVFTTVDPVTLAETIVIRLGAVQHDPSIPLLQRVQEPFTPPEPSKPCIVFDDVDDPTVLDVEVPAGVPITTVVTSQFELSPTFANGPRGQRIRLKRRSLTAALNGRTDESSLGEVRGITTVSTLG